MTTANGTYADCGMGLFHVSITCAGPSCEALNDFTNLTCTSENSITTCTNDVVCATPSNFTSQFSISQPSMNTSCVQRLTIDDQKYLVTQDFSNDVAYSNVTTSRAAARVQMPRRLGLF